MISSESLQVVICREDQRRVKLCKTTSSFTSRTYPMLCTRSTCREDWSSKWVWCHVFANFAIAKSWSKSGVCLWYSPMVCPIFNVRTKPRLYEMVWKCLKWFEHLFESSARAAERLQYEHLHCNFQQSLHSRDSPFHQRRRPRFFAATKCWTTSSLLSHFDAKEKYIYIE